MTLDRRAVLDPYEDIPESVHFHRDDEPPLPPSLTGCSCSATIRVRRTELEED